MVITLKKALQKRCWAELLGLSLQDVDAFDSRTRNLIFKPITYSELVKRSLKDVKILEKNIKN